MLGWILILMPFNACWMSITAEWDWVVRVFWMLAQSSLLISIKMFNAEYVRMTKTRWELTKKTRTFLLAKKWSVHFQFCPLHISTNGIVIRLTRTNLGFYESTQNISFISGVKVLILATNIDTVIDMANRLKFNAVLSLCEDFISNSVIYTITKLKKMYLSSPIPR